MEQDCQKLYVWGIALLQEVKIKKNWPICRVKSIQRNRDGFVWSANAFAGINASRNFGKETLERPAKKFVLLLERKEENILNSEMKLKMKYYERRSGLMEKFVYVHIDFKLIKLTN